MNKNNKTLSIFTIVAVFAMGLAVYSYQNASATIISNAQDAPREAIRDAQNVLRTLESSSLANNETRAAIAEGQEGLDNATSALNNATSVLNSLPVETSNIPLGQSAGPLSQDTGSLESSPTKQTNIQ